MELHQSELNQNRKKLEKKEEVIELFKSINKDDKIYKPEKENIIKDSKEKPDLNISLRLEKSLLNFLEYSTIGGLAELGKRKNLYLRIFWMIVVLICSSYALVTIIKKIQIFYNYEVVLEFVKFQEMPTKFPAITICNENPFNEEKAFFYLQEKLNLANDYGAYNLSVRNNNWPEYKFLDYTFISKYSVPVNYMLEVNKLKRTLINDLNETELSNMGYNLDADMLISCQFNGNSCSESNGDFKNFWNNIYGNCYTFNSDKKIYLTGNQNELHLEMTVGKNKNN